LKPARIKNIPYGSRFFGGSWLDRLRHVGSRELEQKIEQTPEDPDQDPRIKKFRHSLVKVAASTKKNILQNRNKILSDISKPSMWAETFALSTNNGKLFTALPVVIPVADAQEFPDLGDAKTLSGKHINIPQYVVDNRIKSTFVIMCYSQFGAPMAEQWSELFQKEFPESSGLLEESKSDPEKPSRPSRKDAQIISVTVMENYFYLKMLRTYLDYSLRSSIKEHNREHALSTYQPNSVVGNYRDILNISNGKACYVFLLDKKARVRWRAVGYPTENEAETLLQFTHKLVSSI
ncbi:ATP10, partial [Acrasis kona]